MAVEMIKRTFCDKCGAEDDLTHYSISRGGAPRKVDLCPKHAKPVDDVYDSARTTRGKGRGAPVVTEKELKRLKAEGKA